jgi:23S rRNA pseudouridine2605 synthase
MSEVEGVRLQKVLAAAGIASRRAAEELIADGRVEVNGRVVSEQGMRVDPARDEIRVDGARVPPQRSHRYLVLNKPRGVLSAMEDPHGRPTLAGYVPEGERLFHVGRLDADTEGLLLLTNDGDLAQRLTHPSYEVSKLYLAEVAGTLTDATAAKLRKGITLDDGPIKPDQLSVVQRTDQRSLVRVRLHSGRNRIVRRMFDAVGHPVRRLSRLAIGPIKLGDLKPGQTRELTRDELGELFDLLGL